MCSGEGCEYVGKREKNRKERKEREYQNIKGGQQCDLVGWVNVRRQGK